MTADATRVEVTWVDTTAAGRPVRLFRPATAAGGTLVWAHGGSWIGGSAARRLGGGVAGWHQPCAELAGLSGWTVVSVECRLAPVHPHPAALLDVAAVVGWASGRGGPVAGGGDSCRSWTSHRCRTAARRRRRCGRLSRWPGRRRSWGSPGIGWPSTTALRRSRAPHRRSWSALSWRSPRRCAWAAGECCCRGTRR
ncbi:hypothetical protein ALI22I_05920 [Saccharothrix sp. ALI-22-I]|nr:hypothetical protein ALI22I_05920 [Saccharothrix sp. ALI-22-I]